MKLDKQTVALLLGALTTLVGGGEMRFAVARVEDKLSAIEHRLDRVERDLSQVSTLEAQQRSRLALAPR